MFSEFRNEYKKIIKNPKSLLVLVILPVLFTFIIGGVYCKTYIYDIPIAVVDKDNSYLSRKIISEFDNNKYLKVIEYEDNKKGINELIQERKVYGGLIIPKDFFENVKEGNAPKSLFLVDGTNMILGNNVYARGTEVLNTLNIGSQLSILEGKEMLPVMAEKTIESLSFIDRILYDPQLSYMEYLFVAIMGIFVQQTFLAVMVPALVEERKYLTQKGGAGKIISKSIVVGSFIFITFLICLFFANRVFYLPVRGSMFIVLIILSIFIINLTVPALLISAFTKDVLKGSQLCMFLSVPTILTAGYVWPEYMMPDLLRIGVKAFWPLIYYANPVKDILIKNVPFEVVLPYIVEGMIYGIVWLPAAVIIFKKANTYRGREPYVQRNE
jgi:ABC-2 type transport system permease protein